MDSYDQKRVVAWILVVVLIIAIFFTFTNHGSFQFLSEEKTVTLKIQDKIATPVTAFGGKLELPISEYSLAVYINGTLHHVRVSHTDYTNCRKRGVFKIYYKAEDGTISKISYIGNPE